MARANVTKMVILAAFILVLSGCTELRNMLAGGTRGYCQHNGDPCTRPAPRNMDTTPPR